jgi:hypothetical protein
MSDNIQNILQDLTGQELPWPSRNFNIEIKKLLSHSGIGYSQLNELLLSLGYDRIKAAFFQFLLNGTADYKKGNAFNSLKQLRVGVNRFRLRAIVRFGSIKFAFKHLSTIDEELLIAELRLFDRIEHSEFSKRHDPLVEIIPIRGDQTYYLGYLIKRDLDNRLRTNPHDINVKNELEIRKKIVEDGKKNHEAYLASDHMDVYVATSMRERHEYQMVNQVVQNIFSSRKLKSLKIRWFDPTQAYCEDRIDKGLVEGLMLKRATCTLYLAQESDTLGKDSELASTLAQGKPVIAYIPFVSAKAQDAYVKKLLFLVKRGSSECDYKQLLLQQLRIFCPNAAWTDTKVMSWVKDRANMSLVEARRMLARCIREHYDKRADTLKNSHPLGIQVHLETGVSNGVLVARSIAECVELIRRVLTNALEFQIKEKTLDGRKYLLLEEKISKSIFRVVTGDRYLTNAFWNFYLQK